MCSVQIQILPQGGETTLFKQFFLNWKDKDQTEGPSEAYVVGKIAKIKQIPFDASTLHSDKAMAAQHGMVDDGAGKVEVRQQAISQSKTQLDSFCILNSYVRIFRTTHPRG